MGYCAQYSADEPTRAEVEVDRGALVLEFGTSWCGHCIAAQPAIEAVLASRPTVRHRKIEDGRGRPLGRSFAVKLWPTLVFLRDGVEQARVVRPHDAEPLLQALQAINPQA